MCTAVSIVVGDHYFGRNLDYEHDFGEKIVITPKKYNFKFSDGQTINNHYAILGTALPYSDYPLYFDAINDKGLSMAGLNFPQYAHYNNKMEGKKNIASFELIPWVLCQCETTKEAKTLLENTNITNASFENITPTPLHWIIADKKGCLVLEQTENALCVYENPVGILTNSPEFPVQLLNLKNYSSISPKEPENKFSEKISLKPYSRGMGAIGLPGDFSSMSRFVRACFVALNSVFGEAAQERVHQFFHILSSVQMPKGCIRVEDGFEITNYSCCYNTDKGIYYYTTYLNSRIYAIDMNNEDLNSENLIIYSMEEKGGITVQNQL